MENITNPQPTTMDGSAASAANYTRIDFTSAPVIHVYGSMRAIGVESRSVNTTSNSRQTTSTPTRTDQASSTSSSVGPAVPSLYAITSQCVVPYICDFILHQGLTCNSPHLAATITIMGLSGVYILLPPLRVGGPQVAERVSYHPTRIKRNRVYRFEVEVERRAGESMTMVREPFEWRKGTGFWREEFGGRHRGWELVRMSDNRGGGRLTRDGKEIVAGCSMMHNIITRGFLRTGSGEKELGSRWALMAFMSSLYITQYWLTKYD